MSVLDAIFGPPRLSNTANPAQWFIDWIGGGDPTTSGVKVDEEKALTYSAVWAATCILTETIASLPCKLFSRRPGDNGRDAATGHPLYFLLHDEPNDETDSFAFWSQQALYLINWGNCYAEIERSVLGNRPLALIQRKADRVKVYRREDGQIEYEVRRDDPSSGTYTVKRENMLHIAGRLSEDGITGKGVIAHARESIGFGIATEKFGAATFGNGARPGGFLTRPRESPALSEPAAKRLINSFNEKFKGVERAHGVALLQEGMDFKPAFMPLEDAQFLQTRQHNVTEIARWYRLPPHLLADLSRATFSNIDSEVLSFVIHSVRPWLVRIERALKRQLIADEEKGRYYMEFVMDALLRGDTKGRAEARQIEFQNGAINLDEWRAGENRNPLPDSAGQFHFVPLNFQTIDKAIEGPAEESPPNEPPPVKPAEEPPKEVPPANEEEQQSQQIAREWLREVVARMLVLEINAMSRAAKEPAKFLEKMEDFYQKHERTMLLAMEKALNACGIAEHCRFVDEHIAKSKDDLLMAAECQPAELTDKVRECLRQWESRKGWNT